jgi:tetratricopeptide (TPR) repeat protein
MPARTPKRDALGTRLSRMQWLLCALAISAAAVPLSAQNDPYSPRFGMGHKPDATVVHSSNVEADPVAVEEKCFPWKLSGLRPATASVTTLKIPPQARREYESACAASGDNNFAEAEQHARNAIGKFQGYPAAWVKLGMIFEEQNKPQEARDACSHAATIDANYLPAYLCRAEVSARNQEWKEVLASADAAIGTKSEGNAYPYYYRARAYLHLNNLVEAQKSALQALDLDANHYEPSFYFVLAQIYEREGDTPNAIAQLQELLKHHPDLTQEDMAKQLLTKLQSQPATK